MLYWGVVGRSGNVCLFYSRLYCAFLLNANARRPLMHVSCSARMKAYGSQGVVLLPQPFSLAATRGAVGEQKMHKKLA